MARKQQWRTNHFLKEATKRAFLYWTVAEQNHSQPILENIKIYIENKKNTTTNDWDQLIQKEAVEKLFKKSEFPKEYTRLKHPKHPKLIELLSNASKQIIEEMINQHIKKNNNK